MRNLILLWFLLLLTILMVGLTLGFIITGTSAFSLWARYYSSGVIRHAACLAADAFETRGPAGLDDFERKAIEGQRTLARLVDESGLDVRGLEVPQILTGVLRPKGDSGSVQFGLTGRGPVAAAACQGPSGKTYTLAILLPGDRMGPILNWPAWGWRLLTVAAIAAAGSSWLAGKLSAPLVKLSQVTRRLASGDLTSRVGPEFQRSVKEISSLASDFDDMAGRIELLVQSQQKLLQHVSHELRTPLTRLGLAVDLARKAAASGQPAEPHLSRIDEESARLNSLIERILRLSRLQTAQDPPAKEPVEMGDFLEMIAADADFEARAAGRGVTLERLDGGRLQGDRDLLRGAIENVIRNAIRYTPPGRAVEVAQVRDAAGNIRITVRDEGPGVPAEKLEAMFEPFIRLGAPPALAGQVPSGFGLGLAIARRSLELHGGSIEAANRPSGGLEVTLRIPAP
jgi:two-component system sensor histidine kinase CpxA